MSRSPDMETITRGALAQGAREDAARRHRPWTAAEDDLVQRHYRARGWAWCAARLPGRTLGAVRRHASLLGAAPLGAWSAREVRTLRRLWGETCERVIGSRLPGRSWQGIVDVAKRLGLPNPSQGLVTMSAAARRAGVEPPTLQKILRAEGVATTLRVRTYVRPGRHPRRWRMVDAEAAMEAVRRYDNRRASRLTLNGASERYRVSYHTMSDALRLLAATRPVEGMGAPGLAWWLAPADVEEALRLWRGVQ